VKRTAMGRSPTAKSRKAAGARRRSASSRSVRKPGGGRKERR
jgi:hypothetical protein